MVNIGQSPGPGQPGNTGFNSRCCPKKTSWANLTTSLSGPTFYSNLVVLLVLLGPDQSRTLNQIELKAARNVHASSPKSDLKSTFSKPKPIFTQNPR